MKKLIAALIASAFATVAFAQDKKAADTKPYSPTPPVAAPAKDAAPMKKDATTTAAPAAKSTKDMTAAPAAKSTKDMTAEEKKAAKAAKKKARADKAQEDLKQNIKKP